MFMFMPSGCFVLIVFMSLFHSLSRRQMDEKQDAFVLTLTLCENSHVQDDDFHGTIFHPKSLQ